MTKPPHKLNDLSALLSGATPAHINEQEADLLEMLGELKLIDAPKLADKGRGGDDLIALLTQNEQQLLKSQGGSGDINPETGLPEFYYIPQPYIPEPAIAYNNWIPTESWIYRQEGVPYELKSSDPLGIANAIKPFADIVGKVGESVINIMQDPRKMAAVVLLMSQPQLAGEIGQYILGEEAIVLDAAAGTQTAVAASTAAKVAGQAVINAALNKGDVKEAVKSALIQHGSPELAKQIGDTSIGKDMEDFFGKWATQAASGAAIAAAMGKDPTLAFITAGADAAINKIIDSTGLDAYLPKNDYARNAVVAAVRARMTGKDAEGAAAQSIINTAMREASTGLAVQKKLADSGLPPLTEKQLSAIPTAAINQGYIPGLNTAEPVNVSLALRIAQLQKEADLYDASDALTPEIIAKATDGLTNFWWTEPGDKYSLQPFTNQFREYQATEVEGWDSLAQKQEALQNNVDNPDAWDEFVKKVDEDKQAAYEAAQKATEEREKAARDAGWDSVAEQQIANSQGFESPDAYGKYQESWTRGFNGKVEEMAEADKYGIKTWEEYTQDKQRATDLKYPDLGAFEDAQDNYDFLPKMSGSDVPTYDNYKLAKDKGFDTADEFTSYIDTERAKNYGFNSAADAAEAAKIGTFGGITANKYYEIKNGESPYPDFATYEKYGLAKWENGKYIAPPLGLDAYGKDLVAQGVWPDLDKFKQYHGRLDLYNQGFNSYDEAKIANAQGYTDPDKYKAATQLFRSGLIGQDRIFYGVNYGKAFPTPDEFDSYAQVHGWDDAKEFAVAYKSGYTGSAADWRKPPESVAPTTPDTSTSASTSTGTSTPVSPIDTETPSNFNADELLKDFLPKQDTTPSPTEPTTPAPVEPPPVEQPPVEQPTQEEPEPAQELPPDYSAIRDYFTGNFGPEAGWRMFSDYMTANNLGDPEDYRPQLPIEEPPAPEEPLVPEEPETPIIPEQPPAVEDGTTDDIQDLINQINGGTTTPVEPPAPPPVEPEATDDGTTDGIQDVIKDLPNLEGGDLGMTEEEAQNEFYRQIGIDPNSLSDSPPATQEEIDATIGMYPQAAGSTGTKLKAFVQAYRNSKPSTPTPPTPTPPGPITPNPPTTPTTPTAPTGTPTGSNSLLALLALDSQPVQQQQQPTPLADIKYYYDFNDDIGSNIFAGDMVPQNQQNTQGPATFSFFDGGEVNDLSVEDLIGMLKGD